MQHMLDNVAAILIGGILFLIMVGVNHRSRTSAMEASNFYALKKQQIGFVEILKRDMHNVVEVLSMKEDPITLSFNFLAYTTPGDQTIRNVSYVRRYKTTVDGKNLYEIKRMVDGVQEGGSVSTITSWTIVAQNEEGVPVVSLGDTRLIFVKFDTINPFMEGETIKGTTWQAEFRPPLLQTAKSV